jgi:tetratricopeptide (TPR) repeat protein
MSMNSQGLKRGAWLAGAVFIWGLIVGVFPAWSQDGSSECEQLKKDYAALKINYDNAVAQAKALLVYKNQARDLDTVRGQCAAEREEVVRTRDEALAKIQELKLQIKDMEKLLAKANLEKDEFKKSFEKATVNNIMGEDIEKKIQTLETEKSNLAAKISALEGQIKSSEYEGLKKDAESEMLRRQVGEMQSKYEEVRKNNSVLEEKLTATPGRLAELARENKVLIKRTSMMHYNLGVFYVEQKEFSRALAEFEKAVELNPDDANSYFNLGYI